MKSNRSIPEATVVPVLVLSIGDGAVIVADVRPGQRSPREDEVTHRGGTSVTAQP